MFSSKLRLLCLLFPPPLTPPRPFSLLLDHFLSLFCSFIGVGGRDVLVRLRRVTSRPTSLDSWLNLDGSLLILRCILGILALILQSGRTRLQQSLKLGLVRVLNASIG